MMRIDRRTSLLLLLGMAAAPALRAQDESNVLLLVLAKRDRMLEIIDPGTRARLARVPAGPDPHEVVASPDGRFAYISNYGGPGSDLHQLSIVDLVARKPMPNVDLGPLHSTHGLAFAGGKVYFTAETSKVIGRLDPGSRQVEWVLGTGQDRTHMLVVTRDLKTIITSNVNSSTISIINQTVRRGGPPPGGGPSGPPPPGGPEGPPPGGPDFPQPGGQGAQQGGGPPPANVVDWAVTQIPVGRGDEGFDISPDERVVWVANAQDGTISIVDVAAKQVLATLDAQVEGANRVKFTPDGKLVLVSSLNTGELVVMEVATRREIKRLKLGRGAAGILLAPDGSRAFVACSPDNSLAVLDLQTLSVIARVPTGNEPDGMAWAKRTS